MTPIPIVEFQSKSIRPGPRRVIRAAVLTRLLRFTFDAPYGAKTERPPRSRAA